MNLTKLALSTALKEVMLIIPFDKITIHDVTEKAGVSRNTFYYHFYDINELLEWTYAHEIVIDLEAFRQLDNWKEGLMKVLNYTEENKKFCLNTFNSLSRDRLELFLYDITYDMLISITEKYCVSQKLTHEIADFYGRGIVAQVVHWLNTRLEEPKVDLINRIERVTRGVIQLIVSDNHNK